MYPLLQPGQNFIWVHRKGILLAHKTRDSVDCSLDSIYLFFKKIWVTDILKHVRIWQLGVSSLYALTIPKSFIYFNLFFSR